LFVVAGVCGGRAVERLGGVTAMSDCIQLIANFVSLHLCIFSEQSVCKKLA
jgi:hypothetical protein